MGGLSMKLFNDGRAWMGMIEIPLVDICRAERHRMLNALLVSRGFNPYHGYYTMGNYAKLTQTFIEK